MFRNYLKITWRNIIRNKAHTLINILGLSLGMACFCLLFLYIQDEWGFDRIHADANRMYRVIEQFDDPEQGIRRIGVVAGPIGESMVQEFPEVEAATSLISFGQSVSTIGDSLNPQIFNERAYFIAQENFFDLFDFEVLAGDASSCLSSPSSVVLTTSTAKKYFGDENPIGKVFNNNRAGNVQVSAIVADPPANSHLQFNFLLSHNMLTQQEGWRNVIQSWDRNIHYTYLRMAEGHDISTLQAQLPAFQQKHRGDEWAQRSIELQPFLDIHFESGDVEFGPDHAPGNKAYVWVFMAICAFILIIGSINYTNLATARSMHRGREIGVRKVIGAHRWQLISQFMAEAIAIAIFAGMVAVLLAELSLGAFNELSGKEFELNIFSNQALGVSLLTVILLVGILSGVFPALFLSNLKPIRILKGELKTGNTGWRLRQGLVVTQFVLSIFMMIATGIVYHQLTFIQQAELGFDQSQKVVIDINSGSTRNNFQAIKTEFLKHPEVQKVSVTSRVPGEWKNIREITLKPRTGSSIDSMNSYFFCFDEDAIETFDMKIVAGNNFSGNVATDSSAFLLNETAAKALGLDEPVGSLIDLPGLTYPIKVVGIVKDFHFRSLHQAIEPLAIGFRTNPIQSIDYFTCHISGNHIPSTIAHLTDVHNQFDPETPIEYHFLDQQIDRFYQNDIRAGKIFALGALLTIFIACLGLFGLASFAVEQRSREISIRKVLGASVKDLLFLLSRQFALQVLLAFVIAAPLAYFFMADWLQNFAYKVNIHWGIIFGSGILSLVIALVTVSYRSAQAAMANPADTLKVD